MRGCRLAGLSRRRVLLAGCTVGPDYQRPAAPVPAAYKEAAAGQVARPADAIDRGAWWSIYHDPVLDGLERQIDISNQNLKAAEAAFRQAEAVVAQARAGFFPTAPTINALGDARSRAAGRRAGTGARSSGGSGTISNLFSATAVGELDPRSVGQGPPHRRGQRRHRPGQRRRSRQRPPRGAGPAGQRLHAAAGRRRAEAAARRRGQGLWRIAAHHPEPVQCRDRRGLRCGAGRAPSWRARGPRRSRSA